jgi:hypothetical protein
MTKYETDKLRSDLREFILMCREHAARTEGSVREANLSHMNEAIRTLKALSKC